MAVLGDDRLIIDLSVWRDADALTRFMYAGRHREPPARRREWFEHAQESMTALWWVPEGRRPTVADAGKRLPHLCAHGPTARVSTLRSRFPAPVGGRPGERSPPPRRRAA
ncbi:DUF3291 domain-containing protein [Streptomyces sp. NPDC052164]|uniref:DUF3291 domain-containing protein n=1 Tax=Streptomyces sp. NPDC052164 TaxID=3155529 RepID=UPI0034497B07